MRRRSLSPAQLRFFKISPCNLHHSHNPTALQLLEHSLLQTPSNLNLSTSTSTSRLSFDISKIPKNSPGNYQSTVRNFNILINKNLGYQTNHHQIQKFGEGVKGIKEIMIMRDKERLMKENRGVLNERIRELSDVRVKLEKDVELEGMALTLTLHSFELRSSKPSSSQSSTPLSLNKLPLQYLKLLTKHVSSSHLVQYICQSIKPEGNQLVIDYDRIYTRVKSLKNGEEMYDRKEFEFQKYGHQLMVRVPVLEIECKEVGWKQERIMLNEDMLKVVEEGFEKGEWVLEKYLDKEGLENVKKELEREKQKQKQ